MIINIRLKHVKSCIFKETSKKFSLLSKPDFIEAVNNSSFKSLLTHNNSHIFKEQTGKMLPLSLLKTAEGHPMLIEMKNGDTYNGRLVSCNMFMNICLKDVICTSKVC